MDTLTLDQPSEGDLDAIVDFRTIYAISRFWTPQHIDMTNAKLVPRPASPEVPGKRRVVMRSWMDRMWTWSDYRTDTMKEPLMNLRGNRDARRHRHGSNIDSSWGLGGLPSIRIHDAPPSIFTKVMERISEWNRRRESIYVSD